MNRDDREIEGTTWTERDVRALLALYDEAGGIPSVADCVEARKVLNALRCEVLAKLPRAKRGGVEAFAKLAGRHHDLRRLSERLANVSELAREARVA